MNLYVITTVEAKQFEPSIFQIYYYTWFKLFGSKCIYDVEKIHLVFVGMFPLQVCWTPETGHYTSSGMQETLQGRAVEKFAQVLINY